MVKRKIEATQGSLESALARAEDPETRFYIREAMQLLEVARWKLAEQENNDSED